MIPKEVADIADILAAEFGGEMDDHIAVAYRILNSLKQSAAGPGTAP